LVPLLADVGFESGRLVLWRTLLPALIDLHQTQETDIVLAAEYLH
jgi:hypothetical protein